MTTIVYPHEILSAVCAAIYEASQPTSALSLDPPFTQGTQPPSNFPSSYPAPNWPEPASRKTLANLCLVSHSWFAAAKPYLWRHVEVRLPRSWLSFVEQVSVDDDTEETAEKIVDESVKQAMSIALATSRYPSDPDTAQKLHLSIIAQLSGLPIDSIPPELLSPPASRDPSPARLRAKSPGRWRFMRAVSDAVQSLEPDVYVPTPADPRPGRYVQHLDFNHFRTIGMRRSVGEGVHSRFVTASRVENVLKEMPNLRQFGATEYMDGALDEAVLVELLLRGRALPDRNDRGRRDGGRHRRDDEADIATHDEDEDCERRRECQELESLDLCGCVSSVFVQAMDEFASQYLGGDLREDGSRGPSEVSFPSLKRLGLRGVASVSSSVLSSFVQACTGLTHLDLSGTRCAPELLVALGDSPSMQLTSLALSRCTRLDGDSIAEFLVNGLPAKTITELSLYGDGTFLSPLTGENLSKIITQAPCFLSGQLQYLDLSNSPLTPALLQMFAPQVALRSLGLSYIPDIQLSAIADFILKTAPNTEILTLQSTSVELGHSVSWRQLSLALHSLIIRPLATPPFKFSLSSTPPVEPPATRLRVIELGIASLNSLGAGADAWKVIRSKGGRGWYVNTACGWVDGVLRYDLKPSHPIRTELERLSASNGNVGSGVGWHARKMEILQGRGMLGREEGLYGAVSFAYQG